MCLKTSDISFLIFARAVPERGSRPVCKKRPVIQRAINTVDSVLRPIARQ